MTDTPPDVGGDGLGHGHEVEVGEVGRHDQQLRAGLADAEADLALAVDGQHRVLGGAEAGDGADQDHRLEPGGQLPGDHVARGDAVLAGQPGRRHLDLVAVLARR